MAKKITLVSCVFISIVSPVFANSLSSSQPDELLDVIMNGQKTVKYQSGMVQPDGRVGESAVIGVSASNGRFSIGVKKPLKEGSKLLVNLGIQGRTTNGVATKTSINLGHDVGGDYIGAISNNIENTNLNAIGKLYLDGSYRVGLEADLMSKANIRSLLENNFVAVESAKVGSYYNSFEQQTLSVEANLGVKPKQKDLKDVVISAHFAEHYNTDNKGGGDDYKTSASMSIGYTWGGDPRKQLSTAAKKVQETDYSSLEEFQFRE